MFDCSDWKKSEEIRYCDAINILYGDKQPECTPCVHHACSLFVRAYHPDEAEDHGDD